MEGEFSSDFIKSICLEKNFINKGGNGIVYRIPEFEYVVKTIEFRFKKKLLDDFSKKRYTRFCDEIKVVKANQDKISGILPITSNSKLPKNVKKSDFIYYIMPYAQCINEVEFPNLKSKVEAILDLFKTLEILHSLDITHRDIKPSNIYKYKEKFVYSDFGLVHYPEKADISEDEKKIGPWTTIAPEMERDPFHADSKSADIYSLAKTFWILLTGKQKSFEGQYNKHESTISITNYINIPKSGNYNYLGIIHEILTKSTSNNPKSRPSIEEITSLLSIWLKNDIKELCKLEWNYLMLDIAPSCPETMIWKNVEKIGEVLNIIGNTYGLNHMFLPGGGGQDLHGCKVSNNKEIIELDVGYQFVLKPKSLQLKTYSNFEWNHFYLETEPFIVDSSKSDLMSNEYFQLDENTYIEPWWENYNEYNGEIIPEHSKKIIVYHYGNFAIFPKISFYNLILEDLELKITNETYFLDVYDALHQKIGNTIAFENFIKNIILYTNSEKVNDKDFINTIIKYGRKKAKKNTIDYEYHSQVDEVKQKLISLSIDKEISKFINTDVQDPLYYNLFLSIEVINTYILSNSYKFVEYVTGFDLGNFLEAENNNNKAKDLALKIPTYQSAMSIKEELRKIIKPYLSDKKNKVHIEIYCKSNRISKMYNPIFTEKDVIFVLKKGDDSINSKLVIDKNGNLALLNSEEFQIEKEFLSAELFSFNPHQNILGENSGERLSKFVDDNYYNFMVILYHHLKSGEKNSNPDEMEIFSKEELIKEIRNHNSKYK